MTPIEAAIVRDLRARLRLRDEEIGRLERRICYLERDKRNAQTRAREAVDKGRYWYGVAVGVLPRKAA